MNSWKYFHAAQKQNSGKRERDWDNDRDESKWMRGRANRKGPRKQKRNAHPKTDCYSTMNFDWSLHEIFSRVN